MSEINERHKVLQAYNVEKKLLKFINLESMQATAQMS